MKKLALKFWKDPVWSKVIASGILLACGSIGMWFFDLWPMIQNALMRILALFSYEIHIPVWLIIILVPLLIFLIPLVKSAIPDRNPKFIKYTSENILGINWFWEWSHPNIYNEKYSIKNLHARCPSCNSSLEVSNSYGPLVKCINDNCSWKWQQSVGFHNTITHYSQLEQKIHNVIDRNLFNDEYKT